MRSVPGREPSRRPVVAGGIAMTTVVAADACIEKRVREQLAGDVRLRGAAFGVTVADGFVTLTGVVFDWHQRMAAQDAAQRADGVVEVANEIHVALPWVG